MDPATQGYDTHSDDSDSPIEVDKPYTDVQRQGAHPPTVGGSKRRLANPSSNREHKARRKDDFPPGSAAHPPSKAPAAYSNAAGDDPWRSRREELVDQKTTEELKKGQWLLRPHRSYRLIAPRLGRIWRPFSVLSNNVLPCNRVRPELTKKYFYLITRITL